MAEEIYNIIINQTKIIKFINNLIKNMDKLDCLSINNIII